MAKNLCKKLAGLTLVLVLFTSITQAQTPQVQRVEPPDWYVGLPAPTLLITGQNLVSAKAYLDGKNELTVKASENGHYAFVALAETPSGGEHTITLKSQSGDCVVKFPVHTHQAARNQQKIGVGDFIYQLMPDRFAQGPGGSQEGVDRKNPVAYHGGNLNGIRAHLDYIKSLGVTTVLINPIYAQDTFPSQYHGYFVGDFYGVNPHLGNLEDLKDLVAQAHAKGLKLVLDVEAGYTGPNNLWVEDPPAKDWFHGDKANHLNAFTLPFANLVDPHKTRATTEALVNGWEFNIMPDLNSENPAVQTYLRQNLMWWVATAGLDGLRLDSFTYVTTEFWSKTISALNAVWPDLFTVGEIFNFDPSLTAYFAGGEVRPGGIDSHLETLFDFPLWAAMREALLRGKPMTLINDVFQRDWLYPHPERLVTFAGNHDTIRWMSEKGASTQNWLLAHALILTCRGIPDIYTGDEIRMEGGQDPDNRRDFFGGFPGDIATAFNADVATNPIAQLAQLRKNYPALATGSQFMVAATDSVLAYLRVQGSERVLVILNKSDKPTTLKIDFQGTPAEGKRPALIFRAAGEMILDTNGITPANGALSIGPNRVQIYSLN